MLATDNLLKELNDTDTVDYKNRNEDYNLVGVFSHLNDSTTKHKLRYSDGTEDYFSFN